MTAQKTAARETKSNLTSRELKKGVTFYCVTYEILKQSRINTLMCAFASSNYGFLNPANDPVTTSRNKKTNPFEIQRKAKSLRF